MIRSLVAAALLLLAAPAFPQAEGQEAAPAAAAPDSAAPAETPAAEAPPPPAPPAPVYATQKVLLATEDGPIVIEVETERAPVTAANFLKYVDQKRFDGVTFYRALRFPDRDDDLGLIQGGTQGDPKRVLPPIAHEPTTKTGLTHDHGAISMARAAPGTAQGDFFIIFGGLPALDANPLVDGDNQGFAVFGHVVDGFETIKTILESPVSPDKGEGSMKGQMLEKPVRIISARRLAD